MYTSRREKQEQLKKRKCIQSEFKRKVVMKGSRGVQEEQSCIAREIRGCISMTPTKNS